MRCDQCEGCSGTIKLVKQRAEAAEAELKRIRERTLGGMLIRQRDEAVAERIAAEAENAKLRERTSELAATIGTVREFVGCIPRSVMDVDGPAHTREIAVAVQFREAKLREALREAYGCVSTLHRMALSSGEKEAATSYDKLRTRIDALLNGVNDEPACN
jgi:hypothetical protein